MCLAFTQFETLSYTAFTNDSIETEEGTLQDGTLSTILIEKGCVGNLVSRSTLGPLA